MQKVLKSKLNSEVTRFAAVGAVNTVLDFAVLNVLMQAFGVAEIPANFISVSLAMCFSFFANKKLVFNADKTKKTRREAVLFIVVTALSVYGVQNLIIYFLTDLWESPLQGLHDVFDIFTEEVFISNVAKMIATGASLVWNFYFYKNLVFTDEKRTKKTN